MVWRAQVQSGDGLMRLLAIAIAFFCTVCVVQLFASASGPGRQRPHQF